MSRSGWPTFKPASHSHFHPTLFPANLEMSTPIPHPDNQPLAASSQPRTQRKSIWPRLKGKVREEELREETKARFDYYPHDWQLQAAVKVLEGNDGMVVAGTGKGKTIIFALLGLAAELSKTNGHYIIVSPLKALEGDQVSVSLR
jgi:ATP-dependent helicase YprA (DUF1998 family)